MNWRPRYLVLHHSAGAETPEQLAKQGKYHHVVNGQGVPRLVTSVPIDRATTFAVGGANSQCYSLCVTGNFEIQQTSVELLRFLANIFAARCRAWELPPERIVSHGWIGRNVAIPRYSTQCCGRHLEAQLAYLRASVVRYL